MSDTKFYTGVRLDSLQINDTEHYTDFHRGFCIVKFDNNPISSFFSEEIFSHPMKCFEWGYLGSAPINLAYSILYHHFDLPFGEEPNDIIKTYVWGFAKHCISRLQKDRWRVSSDKITSILKKIEEQYLSPIE